MSTKWLTLFIIIMLYLPVTIDATILYVVAPVLSMEMKTTMDQLLWIMDIYPLVMAGLMLPMGVLGDRIGFRKLAMLGSTLFGLASAGAAFASTPLALIMARALLAVGASMIVPATLAGVRRTFPEEKERNLALGIWTTVGTCGALIGPLAGGVILSHFSWGTVFFINVPLVIAVLFMLCFFVPAAEKKTSQAVNTAQALTLTAALLLMIYSLKKVFSPDFSLPIFLALFSCGCVLMGIFIRSQLRSRLPLLDLRLFAQHRIAAGVMMALTAMIVLVGFELVLSQELQLVHRLSPLEAGLYLLPLMVASGLTGPVAGWLISRYGLRIVALSGLATSALSLYRLAGTDFSAPDIIAWFWMCALGCGATVALMASSSAIMSAAPVEKANAAGSIEGVSYELGTGLGIAIFGSILANIYTASVKLPAGLPVSVNQQASLSFNDALAASIHLNEDLREQVISAATSAFMHSHAATLQTGAFMLLALTIITGFILKKRHE
ncbi:MFS transporter [Cronobacter dublinensis]